MGEYTQKISLWALGLIVSAFAFLLKFIYNLLVENSARKVELQIINKFEEFAAKMDARFTNIDTKFTNMDAKFTNLKEEIERNTKHTKKNSEHEINLLSELKKLLNNDINNRHN